VSETTPIATDDLRALFDIATSSVSFGSGYLETDEVELLRKIAVLIGVDPWEATPSSFRRHYSHAHRPNGRNAHPNWADNCADCGQPSADKVHSKSEEA
jgi:hypothetical protein